MIKLDDGNKYVFNDSNTYNSHIRYGLSIGQYIFKNIPFTHPMALLNKNNPLITYSGNKTNRLIKKVHDKYYEFYYGDIEVSVLGDFEELSIYCYYHGYMGGRNLLKYSSSCLGATVQFPRVGRLGARLNRS